MNIEAIYQRAGGDPSFEEILASSIVDGDDGRLADVIDSDGRLRMKLNKPVELSRYVDAVGDLRDKPASLDAAIEMSLRWIARAGQPDPESVEQLIRKYPDLESSIRESAALSNAIWSTTRLRMHLAVPEDHRKLPCAFGPQMSDGRERYELRALLGEGSFGRVYRAIDRQMSEEGHAAIVSIKVLNRGDRSEWDRQCFIDEATKARRIDHPNVVRVLDRGTTDDDEDYIVHEFIEGGDLGRWVRRRIDSLEPEHAAQIVAHIASGVHAAHMAGLVHCDIKPGNIMMTSDDEPKVADFGIAIRANEQDQGAEDEEILPQGNIAFISPEQYRCEPGALTVPSDIYALGGILFWLLTDQLPNGADPDEIHRTHSEPTSRTAPPPVRPERPEVDRDLEAICQRAMAPEPADRCGSARSLADDLETWMRREPVAWTRPSVPRRLMLWTRRNPGLAAAFVIMLMLAIMGAGALQRAAHSARELNEEERVRQQSILIFRSFVAKLQESKQQGIEEELLPSIWVMEWLLGPTVLTEGTELWKLRFDIVRHAIAEGRAVNGGDHLQTMFWENVMGFWLVSAGDYEEAAPMLAETSRRWKQMLEPDDPWLQQLEVLQSAAEVNRHIAEIDDAASLGDALAALRSVASKLEGDARVLARDEPDSQIVAMALERLRVAYGSACLDDDASLRDAEGALEPPTRE